jgi:hypothetical protein
MKSKVDLEALPSLEQAELERVQGGFIIAGAGVSFAPVEAPHGFVADLFRRLSALGGPWKWVPAITDVIA